MCWNYPVSIGLALVGAGAAYTQYVWKRPTGRIIFFAYWALIEVLQALQYTVIDQCDSSVNKVGLFFVGRGSAGVAGGVRFRRG
jgi:hypothetical protein